MVDSFTLEDLESLDDFDTQDEFLTSNRPGHMTSTTAQRPVSAMATANPVARLVAETEAALGLASSDQDRALPQGPFGSVTHNPLAQGAANSSNPVLKSEDEAMALGLPQEVLQAVSALYPEGDTGSVDPFGASPVQADNRPVADPQPLPPSTNQGGNVRMDSSQDPDTPLGVLAVSALNDTLPIPASASREVQIPRIAIHVFADRQDSLAAAERAGQDRRMSRATTQIRVGGIPAAINAYQSENTPPLVIVESMADARTLLEQVDALAEVCDTGTKVIIMGATNDIQLYRELIQRGVSEYLVAPIQPLQLISAIDGLFADPAQPFVGRSIAFVGARGGAGSSSVAHNTAYAMSERIGVNTVIVDYDLPFGTAGLDFNQDPLSGVADALSQPDRLDATLLDRMMARCTDRLSLFAAPATLDGDWNIRPEAYEEVTSRIRSTAPFVVLDLPHLWSSWMRKTLISADEVVVVATPDLASLRNAKNMIDLVKQGRPNDAPPRLVLNQVGMPGRPEIPAKDFGAALGIHPSLTIPFDAKLFGAAANSGQMLMEVGSKSRAVECFETLAQIVSCRELPAATTKGHRAAKSRNSSSLLASLFTKKR